MRRHCRPLSACAGMDAKEDGIFCGPLPCQVPLWIWTLYYLLVALVDIFGKESGHVTE
jgi:hypothetical protein